MQGHRIVVIAVVTALMLPVAAPARADDPRAELEKAQNKLEYVQQQREQAKNALATAYWKSEESKLTLQQVEQELATANSQLAVVSNQHSVAEGALRQVEAELDVTGKQVTAQQGVLAKRVRALNEEGRVSYLAVLLGANSFSDFVSRYELLRQVVRRDARLFEEFRAAKRQLEEQQKLATARRNRLAGLVAQREGYRNQVASKQAEQQRIAADLQAQAEQLKALIDEYDREEANLAKQVAELQRQLARKAGRFDPLLPVAKGTPITDDFGPGIDPVVGGWRNHGGTDFGAREGTPILAIEDGTVLISGWHRTYGNLVVIDHGGNISSWYAHASRRLVEEGQAVKRGQQIALVGSTGYSTGPHLHLEIHVNGAKEDPMKYLPKP